MSLGQEANTKSRVFQALTENELRKIVTDYYGNQCKISNCRLMKGGLFNTTYHLETNQDDGKVVLRVGPVNKHLLFNFEKDMMAAEPMFHQMMHDHGIPTSEIMKYSPEGRLIDRDYLMVRYIDAIPMNDPSLHDVDLSHVSKQIGHHVRKLHSIQNDRFGWKRPHGNSEYDTWYKFVKVFADEAADKAEEYNLIEQSDVRLFRDIFSSPQHKELLEKVTVPYMVHNDIWPGNVLISKINNEYRLAAIIDVDRAIFGDIAWESMTEQFGDAYLNGYGEAIDVTGDSKQRKKLYTVIMDFFSLYVVLIEYDDTSWYDSFKDEAISRLHAI